MNDAPYLTYSRYLRDRFGCVVYRVAVDAGFGCPNRESGRGSGGCIYCGENGSRAPYLERADGAEGADGAARASGTGSLQRQIEASIAFVRRRYSAAAFILYFQAFSNTNAPVGELARIYDEGLAAAPFLGLTVATRPDCIDEQKARLLSSYRERGLEVWVELGLQSANDRTLQLIDRGHNAADYLRAYGILKAAGVKVAVHLILGLPGERAIDMERTARFVAGLEPDGVKIHNLHIPTDTPLARDFLRGEVTAPGPERHMEYAIALLERLPAETVVMRLASDTPAGRLAAPRRFWSKHRFAVRLAEEMRRRGGRQGRLFAAGAVRA
ncbi:MAG: TIGR01212 family radical SAM protein [Spirochaetes bacterium]|nr:TIGR01212 family radical SAM protein [Spirochaetota bacterium]